MNVLVFHLGGCTLEASILNHRSGRWEIRACERVLFTGGCIVDDLLVNDCMAGIEKDHKISKEEKITIRKKLLVVCQRAKLKLSKQETCEIDASVLQKYPFSYTLTRSKFAVLCTEVQNKCTQTLDILLNKEAISRNDIHKIIIEGGSTQLHWV